MSGELLAMAEEASQPRRPPSPDDRLAALERRMSRLEVLLYLAVGLGVLEELKPILSLIGG